MTDWTKDRIAEARELQRQVNLIEVGSLDSEHGATHDAWESVDLECRMGRMLPSALDEIERCHALLARIRQHAHRLPPEIEAELEGTANE